MIIGLKLKELRESQHLSQGDIEHRTGMLRCYISRVENGHTIPAVETLQKFAQALGVPMYQLFHDGKTPVEKPEIIGVDRNGNHAPLCPKERRELRKFAKALSRMDDDHRKLFLAFAQRLANHHPEA